MDVKSHVFGVSISSTFPESCPSCPELWYWLAGLYQYQESIYLILGNCLGDVVSNPVSAGILKSPGRIFY